MTALSPRARLIDPRFFRFGTASALESPCPVGGQGVHRATTEKLCALWSENPGRDPLPVSLRSPLSPWGLFQNSAGRLEDRMLSERA
jgi:hypothetical protein